MFESVYKNSAWDAPLEKEDKNKLELGGVLKLITSNELTVDKTIETSDPIAALKNLAQRIEDDIAYFGHYNHQGMAMNRLSFIKKDILEIVGKLEEVCLIEKNPSEKQS